MWIADVYLTPDNIDGEDSPLGLSPMKEYEEGPFSFEILQKQVEETVDDESLRWE